MPDVVQTKQSDEVEQSAAEIVDSAKEQAPQTLVATGPSEPGEESVADSTEPKPENRESKTENRESKTGTSPATEPKRGSPAAESTMTPAPEEPPARTEPLFTLNLEEIRKERPSDKITANLNSVLISLATVMEHNCGLQIKDSIIKSDPLGGFTFNFNDPMGEIPAVVNITLLSPVIFEGNDHFHAKFVTLCALEMICYHNDGLAKSYEIDSSSFQKSSHTSWMGQLDKLARKAFSANRKSDEKLLMSINSLKGNGVIKRSSFSTMNEARILKRIGYLLEVAKDQGTATGDFMQKLSLSEFVKFSDLMLSRKNISYGFSEGGNSTPFSIRADFINVAKHASLYRISRFLSGLPNLKGMPSMRLVFDKSLSREPDFIFGYNNEKELIFIPGSLVRNISARKGDSFQNGMIMLGKEFELLGVESEARMKSNYFSTLPDTVSELTSALYLSIGAVGRAESRHENFRIQIEAKELGDKYLSSDELQEVLKGRIEIYSVMPENHKRYY